MSLTEKTNGEADVQLHSIIAHETDTGYAQCFRADAENPRMGTIDLNAIEFSPAIREKWSDPDLFERIKSGQSLPAPTAGLI